MKLIRCDDEQTSESPASLPQRKVKLKKDIGNFVETFVDCACLTIQNFIV